MEVDPISTTQREIVRQLANPVKISQQVNWLIPSTNHSVLQHNASDHKTKKSKDKANSLVQLAIMVSVQEITVRETECKVIMCSMIHED